MTTATAPRASDSASKKSIAPSLKAILRIHAELLDSLWTAQASTPKELDTLCLGLLKEAKASGLPRSGLSAALPGKQNPLILCAMRGCLRSMQWLLKQGADPNAKNMAGQNASALAAACRQIDALALLSKAGCDLANVDNDGNTIIHDFVEAIGSGSESESIITMAVEAGADPFAPNRRGVTPIDMLERRMRAYWIGLEDPRFQAFNKLCAIAEACAIKKHIEPKEAARISEIKQRLQKRL